MSKAAGLDEIDADGVGDGEAVGSVAVEVGGWLWEAGKEVGIAIGRAFAVIQSIGVSGEELQPALNASIVLSDPGDILEDFVIGVDQELGGPEVATEAFSGPDDATGFEVEGGPGSFVVEVGATDEDDGADGTIGLFLLEGCAETVDAGVAVKAKRAGVVRDGVRVRVDQGRGLASSWRI